MRGTEDIPLDPALLIRLGVIASVDLAEARCTVRYGDPDGDEMVSPPLRWTATRVGETRIWSPPSVGEQVELVCPDGEIDGGYVRPAMFSDEFPPPSSDPTPLIEFKDGAIISYDPEGHALTVDLPAGGTITLNCAGGLTINGPVDIQGSLAVSEDAEVQGTVTGSTDVIGGGKSLKSHRHTGITAGGAVSGPPQ